MFRRYDNDNDYDEDDEEEEEEKTIRLWVTNNDDVHHVGMDSSQSYSHAKQYR